MATRCSSGPCGEQSQDSVHRNNHAVENRLSNKTAGPSCYKSPATNSLFTLSIYKFGVPGKIKRREVELDPQVSPEQIMSREM